MSADWTTCRVVRDRLGGLMGRRGDAWRGLCRLGLHDFTRSEMDDYAREFGPLTPVLDADGLPVVTTVGDLTARHIGRRVRIDKHYDAKLETIFAHGDGEVSLNFSHTEGFTYGCSRTIDTPCEVLS